LVKASFNRKPIIGYGKKHAKTPYGARFLHWHSPADCCGLERNDFALIAAFKKTSSRSFLPPPNFTKPENNGTGANRVTRLRSTDYLKGTIVNTVAIL